MTGRELSRYLFGAFIKCPFHGFACIFIRDVHYYDSHLRGGETEAHLCKVLEFQGWM